jgi:hypothetical protein
VANPGNVIQEVYTYREVADLLAAHERGDVLHVTVGGGHLGSPLAHLNEAPYPEKLVEFWIRSYCPPGSLVCDPFSGSGTTGAVAIRLGRRFLGCDNRSDQVGLTRRRLLEVEGGLTVSNAFNERRPP